MRSRPAPSRNTASSRTRRSTSAATSSGACFARRCGTGSRAHFRRAALAGIARHRRANALDPLRGQAHGERAAAPALARDVEVGLVADQHVLDDREAEPGAAHSTRAAAVDAVETL